MPEGQSPREASHSRWNAPAAKFVEYEKRFQELAGGFCDDGTDLVRCHSIGNEQRKVDFDRRHRWNRREPACALGILTSAGSIDLQIDFNSVDRRSPYRRIELENEHGPDRFAICGHRPYRVADCRVNLDSRVRIGSGGDLRSETFRIPFIEAGRLRLGEMRRPPLSSKHGARMNALSGCA